MFWFFQGGSEFYITEQGYPKLPYRAISRSARAIARRGYPLLSDVVKPSKIILMSMLPSMECYHTNCST